MDKHFSRYLDLARFVAALMVVLAHFAQFGMLGVYPPDTLPMFGREAVMVFFVLSGFVIAYTTGEKALSWRQYVVARCARIYSVVIPVVLLCFLLVYLASQVVEISGNSSYQLHKPYVYLPLHFLFLGELWNLSETPPWLIQYWSLGFEVWYYVLFGTVFYLRGTKRLLLAALVMLVMGFKLWLLLPVWLAGVYLYKYQRDLPVTHVQARLGWLLTVVLLIAYKLLGAEPWLRALGNQIWPFPALHLGSADRYLADYVVCIIVYINFLMARQSAFAGLAAFDRPIRSLAAYTFTLYLIHGPVMGLWALLFQHRQASVLDGVLLAASIGLSTWAVGRISEQRKDWFRDLFGALMQACTRRFA